MKKIFPVLLISLLTACSATSPLKYGVNDTSIFKSTRDPASIIGLFTIDPSSPNSKLEFNNDSDKLIMKITDPDFIDLPACKRFNAFRRNLSELTTAQPDISDGTIGFYLYVNQECVRAALDFSIKHPGVPLPKKTLVQNFDFYDDFFKFLQNKDEILSQFKSNNIKAIVVYQIKGRYETCRDEVSFTFNDTKKPFRAIPKKCSY